MRQNCFHTGWLTFGLRQHFFSFATAVLFTLQAGFAQTALVNGGNHPGTIPANGTQTFSFTGAPGDSIILRVGATNVVPKIELLAPNGSTVATAPTVAPGGGSRDALLSSTLSAAGTFLVRVSSYYANGTGPFGLHFAQIPGTPVVQPDDQGGNLAVGAQNVGFLDLGDVDTWTFTGNSGDMVQLRMGTTNLVPKIELYGPTGALVSSVPATAPGLGGRDSLLTTRLAASGTFTVVVSSYYLGNAPGGYFLTLAQSSGDVTVSQGDDGGPLVSGGRKNATLNYGDLDVWTFDGKTGDSVELRMGGDFPPRIDLWAPDGAVVASVPATAPGGGSRDTWTTVRLTATGKYTVVTSSYYSTGAKGEYTLHFVRIPDTIQISQGDEGGPMTNGWHHAGTLEVGDLDAWTFNGTTGDSIQLRMGGTNLVPNIDLFAPDGSLVASVPTTAPGSGNRDVLLTADLNQTGSYKVVVSSYYLGGSGDYGLTLAQAPGVVTISPGDEGGPLINGGQAAGNIDYGDLDLWTFSGSAGEDIQIRMGADFPPRIDLYGPDGALVGRVPTTAPGGGARDTLLEAHLPASGTYLVVASGYYSGSAGAYTINFFNPLGAITVSPGDEGGPLTNGWMHAGSLPVGDVDAWTFNGAANETILLRMGATGLAPRLDLFGPDGVLLESLPSRNPGGGSRDVSISHKLAAAGTYLVLASSYYGGGSGDYNLTLEQATTNIISAPGDEGGMMTNGYTYFGTNKVGDLDIWQFYGTPGDSNVFRIGTVDFVPWLRLYNSSGTLVKEAFTAGGGVRTNQMSFVVTNAGVYTLVSGSYYDGGAGSYNLKQSRVPPDINMPASVAIDEGTNLQLPISSQDPDDPLKPVNFALQSPPPGITLTTLGATNAMISWATTEADGPSTNTVVVTVTDIVGQTPFTRTNTLTIVVNEVNIAPVLTVPGNMELNELTPLAASASATDVDLPKNPLTFSLIDPPQGLAIDPTSGALSWTPTEAQGPGVYNVAVVVTDDSPSAINAQHLSATNSFTITVHEVNLPPQITPVANQSIDEAAPFTLGVAATDPDAPANALTYAVQNAPQGLTINPATGQITWTPTEAQGPSTNTLSVVVMDSSPDAVNEKQLTATATFTIVVKELNAAPTLGTIGQQSLDELTPLVVQNPATDTDLPANILTYRLVGAPEGAQISGTGEITWTPTEAQGPSTNTFTTIVTDNGVPALSATNSFMVIVKEVNTAPTITPVAAAQSTDELKPFSLTISGSDTDSPANTLTYALLGSPAGMQINAANGQITWTPTEEQGPSTNNVTVTVTDNGNPALSATNQFTLIVNEVNTAPVISDIPAQSVHFGTVLSFHATVTDSDLPTNNVVLTLEGAPDGLTLDPATGNITWTPAEAQLGSYAVTLRATDNGTPAQSTTKTFEVNVTGTGASLDVVQLPNNLIEVDISADAGHSYELQQSSDLQTWTTLLQVPLQNGMYQHIEPRNQPRRFYRLKLVQ